MKFSDTTNKNGLVQDFETLIGAADGQISGDTTKLKQVTGFMNQYLHKAVGIILNSVDGWDYDDHNIGDYPILTTDLVANQQDYNLGTTEKIIKIKRVEVTYDGTNWYRAEPFDINERGNATDTTSIASDFTTDKPFYDMDSGSIFLYPIPSSAVTGGLKIWVAREPDEFTSADTTQEPGIDEEFHSYISLGAAVKWAMSKRLDNYATLKNELLELEQRMKLHYSNKVDDGNIQLKSAYINYE